MARDQGSESCRMMMEACLECRKISHFVCDYPHCRDRSVSSVGFARPLVYRPLTTVSFQRQRPAITPMGPIQGPWPFTPQSSRPVVRLIDRVYSTSVEEM